MANTICQQCGGEFSVSPSRVGVFKFCSPECREENRKQKSKFIDCQCCGKEFKVYTRDLPRKKYCSRECSEKSMVRLEKFSCTHCGTGFERKPSLAKWDNVYCSNKCASEHLKVREIKECAVCGKEIERPPSQFKENVICSPECGSIFKSERLKGEKHFSFNSELMSCEICGEEFYEPKSRIEIGKGRFCGMECKSRWMRSAFSEFGNPNWVGGSVNYRGPNWDDQRVKALVRDDFTCQICGSRDRLHVHHIKPYKKFDGDYLSANEVSNLQTLCSSCHLSIEPRIKSHDNTEVNR